MSKYKNNVIFLKFVITRLQALVACTANASVSVLRFVIELVVNEEKFGKDLKISTKKKLLTAQFINCLFTPNITLFLGNKMVVKFA